MPNPLNLSDAADLIDLSIQEIFLKGAETESTLYQQYYNVDSGVTDYYIKDSSLAGLSYAGRIAENAVVTAQSPIQGYDKVFTQVQFGILLSFTKPMWFFGIKKRNLERITSEARKACADLRESRCADRLDNATAASYAAQDISGNYTVITTGGDSVAFLSAAHTREDGGTNNTNIVTDGTTSNMDKIFNVHVKSLLNNLENLKIYLHSIVNYGMMVRRLLLTIVFYVQGNQRQAYI